MFEDLITTPKKDKPLVCKYCGSSNTETSQEISTIEYINKHRCRMLVRCYSCNKVYYISAYKCI